MFLINSKLILIFFLSKLILLGFKKEQIQLFLPNRFTNGYGFSESSFNHINSNFPANNYPLIILTDCGITANTVIKKAKDAGYSVILIDHHQKKVTIPKASAVFWNTSLTASVLSYFFAKFMELKFFKKTNLNNSIDLAALGFVCDLGNLSNTIGNLIVKKGLNIINSNTRAGISNLLSTAKHTKKITSYDMGWVIGPRLNASGRLNSAEESLNLLLNFGDSKHIANNLNNTNNERQASLKQMYEDAVFGLSNKKYIGYDNTHKVILVDSNDYHEGVIGLVSSKLCKQYYKPALTISWGDTNGKGSARSIDGVDITNLLQACSQYLENFGGHTMAAGFEVSRKNFDNFKNKLIEVSNKLIDNSLLNPAIFYDLDITEELLNFELLELLDLLEPYGNGNYRPLFAIKNAKIIYPNTFGSNNEHLGFKLEQSGIRAVFFGNAKLINNVTSAKSCDILFSFEKNEYKGATYPQILVKDLKINL